MQITIRKPDPALEYDALADLLSRVWRQKVTPQSLVEWDQDSIVTATMRRRMVALNEVEKVTGYSMVWRDPQTENGRYGLYVVVDPEQRRQGIGSRLYDEALAFAVAQGAVVLDSEVFDDDEIGLGFARRRGFTIRRHVFQSEIDLHTFDPQPFAGHVAQVEASGIRFFSLAEAGDTQEARRKLHAVNRRTSLDDPASTGSFSDFETFNNRLNNASWFLPQGQILAADGDDYIGLSAVGYFAADNSMYNLMTGVDRAYRGRGIALALKLKAIAFARAYGADTIRTSNDSENEPMLAINRKLGYKPLPGEYRLIKTV